MHLCNVDTGRFDGETYFESLIQIQPSSPETQKYAMSLVTPSMLLADTVGSSTKSKAAKVVEKDLKMLSGLLKCFFCEISEV